MNIILYSTGCPRCSVLEKKLKQKDIPYTEVNDVPTMLNLNIVSVPVLEVDGERMDYIAANTWLNHYHQEGNNGRIGN